MSGHWPELEGARIRLGVAGPYRGPTAECVARHVEMARLRAGRINARWAERGVVAVPLCDISRDDPEAADPERDLHWRREIIGAIEAGTFHAVVFPHGTLVRLSAGQRREFQAVISTHGVVALTDDQVNVWLRDRLATLPCGSGDGSYFDLAASLARTAFGRI